jgi:xanthine dehydrogenase accessory factor
MEQAELYRVMAQLTDEGTPFVLATVVESSGSTPRKSGAKMIILPDGRTIDTVGGGKVEAQVVTDALEALKRGVSRVAEYELRPTGEKALGMVCGGDTKVFLEVHTPTDTLLIIGAGHIAQKLCPMAKLMDLRVVVLDSRPEFATEERFPDANSVIVGHPGEAAGLVDIDERTHVVIVTHGHIHDKDALRSVATSLARYIGMIGSRSKVRTVLTELEEEGIAAAALQRVRAPVGLDLGGHAPAEVALSILAQIVAEQHGKSGLQDLSIAASITPAEGSGALDGAAQAARSGISHDG